MSVEKVAILLNDHAYREKSLDLAHRLSLDVIETESNLYKYVLLYNQHGLQLCCFHRSFNPIYIDFLHGKLRHRRLFGGGKRQALARAVGLSGRDPLTIVDLTAGWGEDAFVLACLGAHVTMLERSDVIAALLQDACDRGSQQQWFRDLSLQFIHQTASEYLLSLKPDILPDVLYFDPMFPEKKANALVKKEMRVIRDIVGEDADAKEIFLLALTKAKRRVVVKRPRLAETIVTAIKYPVDFTLNGKSNRFDIYLSK